MWTLFWDMHSGGGVKQKWAMIYIEAPEKEAKVIFYNRFGHNPNRVTCTCCGDDYSISEEKTLARLSGYHRNCKSLETPQYKSGKKKGFYKHPKDQWWNDNYYIEPELEEEAVRRGYKITSRSSFGDYQTLEQYTKNKDVHVIYEKDIKEKERVGDVPEEGDVWL